MRSRSKDERSRHRMTPTAAVLCGVLFIPASGALFITAAVPLLLHTAVPCSAVPAAALCLLALSCAAGGLLCARLGGRSAGIVTAVLVCCLLPAAALLFPRGPVSAVTFLRPLLAGAAVFLGAAAGSARRTRRRGKGKRRPR